LELGLVGAVRAKKVVVQMGESGSDHVDNCIDTLITDLNSTFRSLLLAASSYEFGARVLDSIDDDALVTATLGLDLQSEPIPLRELKRYRGLFPAIVIELFHGRMVQAWQDCLDQIYAHYVDLHFSGARPFVELGTRHLSLDFRAGSPLSSQAREELIRSYAFEKYSERVRIINLVRAPQAACDEHLFVVKKNVMIRNCCQHSRGILSADLLNTIGRAELVVLDGAGKERTLRRGDAIHLTVAELHAFRRALLRLGQLWRSE